MDSPCLTCDQECPANGCISWRRWFVHNWNTNISTAPKPEKKREFFQYEHPDIVREAQNEQE